MNDVCLVSWCVQRVSRQNLRVLKHMHMKSTITLRSPMPGGLGPLEVIGKRYQSQPEDGRSSPDPRLMCAMAAPHGSTTLSKRLHVPPTLCAWLCNILG